MSRYPANGSRAVEPAQLAVGDLVRLDWDADKWWTVQAVSPNFTACVRPPTDAEREEYHDEYGEDPDGPSYTVLDWRNEVRGPCDLIGQSYGDGTYSPDECERMLAAFEVTDDEVQGALNMMPGGGAFVPDRLEVSQRNWVPLRVLEHRPGGSREVVGRASCSCTPEQRAASRASRDRTD